MDISKVSEASGGSKPPDKKAVAEDRAWARDQDFKATFYFIFKIFVYIASGLLVIVASVRAIHLIIPQCYQWLSEDQLQTIDKLFYSGAIGGILGGYLRDRMSGKMFE